MTREVWFQLVDQEGNAVTSADCVDCADDAKVFRLRDAVKAKCPNNLAGIAPSDLIVFANRVQFDANGVPLDPRNSLAHIDENVTLIVQVPRKPQVLLDRIRQQTEAANSLHLKELVAIAQQLKEAKVGTVLKPPMTIFGLAFDNGLYIRQEYWDLLEIIKQRLALKSWLRRILVVGSPGIGKSVFGVLLLLLFVTEKKHIAYRSLGDPVIYFTWDTTHGYQCSDSPCVGKKYDGLFDGKEAGGALSFREFNRVFLFASPRTINYHEFVKEKCLKVYMNPWTKDECQKFADAMELEDPDEWLRRFNLVGGKPRYLFSASEKFDDLVEHVKREIPHNLDQLKDQVQLFQQQVFDDRMKHIVFHLYRDENEPSRAYLAYSSLAVEAIMTARYQVGSADQLRALLQTPAPSLQS